MSTVRWYGERAKDAMRRGAARGLERWARELVLEPSQEIVPVAHLRGGYLRDSAKMQVDEDELRAAVSYESPPARPDGRMGGANIAVYVHEDMSAHHAPGKRAKFLEGPLNESRRDGPEIVRHEVRKELR